MDESLDFRVDMLIRHLQSLATDLKKNDELRGILIGYTNYLLGPERSYDALADFLEYYGKTVLLPEVMWLLTGTRWRQIVELGPGTGWLIQALGTHLEWGGQRYALDKRDSLFKVDSGVAFRVWDLEETPQFLTYEEPQKTLVVANQFLHCVNNWEYLIDKNRAWWLVAEVNSGAWMRQMRAFGATPLTPKQVTDAFRKYQYEERGRRQTQTLNVTLWRPR